MHSFKLKQFCRAALRQYRPKLVRNCRTISYKRNESFLCNLVYDDESQCLNSSKFAGTHQQTALPEKVPWRQSDQFDVVRFVSPDYCNDAAAQDHERPQHSSLLGQDLTLAESATGHRRRQRFLFIIGHRGEECDSVKKPAWRGVRAQLVFVCFGYVGPYTYTLGRLRQNKSGRLGMTINQVENLTFCFPDHAY